MSTPMIIDTRVKDFIRALREKAMAAPVDMATLAEKLKTPTGKAAHMAQMTDQTIEIPLAYLVTFSIEHGHPCGTCRHMSMSVARAGRVPNEHALWLVAEEFGFWGGLKECMIWDEQLRGHGLAINVVQPFERVVALEKLDVSGDLVS